jgi:diguanylate cyclase (GGDEF)-like protein
MKSDRTYQMLAFTIGYSVLLAAWLLIHPVSLPIVQGVDNVAQSLGEIALAFIVVVMLARASFQSRLAKRAAVPRHPVLGGYKGSPPRRVTDSSRNRRKQALVPVLLCLSALSWGIGQVIYTYYEQVLHHPAPLPSWADAGFLGVYPFLLLGIVLLSTQRMTTISRSRIILDSFMIMTALVTFSWYFILGPTLLQANDSVFARLVGTAYPAGDLLLITCLLMLAARWKDDLIRRAGWLLALALTVIVVTDSVYDYLSLHNAYVTGGIVDVGWPLGYMLIAVAAYCLGRRVVLVSPASAEPLEERRLDTHAELMWRSLLPYALVPAVVGLSIYVFAIGERNELRFGVLIGGSILISLILIRQVLALVENGRLYRDVQAKRAQLEALATTDPLTNLANHRTLMSVLDRELARAARYERPCSIAVLDLDHFKSLNDSLGHASGDESLRQFAELVRSEVRAIDQVARWGGEEFVIVFPETDTQGAVVAAEHLRAAIARHTFPVGGGIHLSCSIGVATLSHTVDSRDRLLELADAAMYAAKRLGRNQVRAVGDRAIAALDASEHSGSRDETALLGTVEALAALVDARDAYTGRHAEEVARLAMRVGLALGMDANETHLVGITGRLHDVGKVAVPDAILQKPGPLTVEEWETIRAHPVVAADVVARVPALRVVAPGVRAHHERWDGEGYPDGLVGEDIPVTARIISVADAFQAMLTERPYGSARPQSHALAEIQRCAGTQFDPIIAATLAQVLSTRDLDDTCLLVG